MGCLLWLSYCKCRLALTLMWSDKMEEKRDGGGGVPHSLVLLIFKHSYNRGEIHVGSRIKLAQEWERILGPKWLEMLFPFPSLLAPKAFATPVNLPPCWIHRYCYLGMFVCLYLITDGSSNILCKPRGCLQFCYIKLY